MSQDIERLKLADALTHLLEECRMVLPGVQALFGFQLIAAIALVAFFATCWFVLPRGYHRYRSGR